MKDFGSPVLKSVMKPREFLGLDRRVFFINLMFWGAFIISLGMYWMIIPAVGAHIFLSKLYQKDYNFFMAYLLFSRQGDFYDPWPRYKKGRNSRPAGWGQDEVLK